MVISRPVLALAMVGSALGGVWLALHGPSEAQEANDGIRNVGVGRVARHIADAMLLPIRLPFAEPTTLEDVAKYLRKELNANVVIDRAALNRKELEPTDTVQVDLTDVRLKTGLKLLLDQVGLTTRVVPEDNLLIITDTSESEEPIERVLEEIKALHRDVHSLQDEVRDLRSLVEFPPEEEPVARMRVPTIIEEKPEGAGKPKADDEPIKPKVEKDKSGRTRPGV